MGPARARPVLRGDAVLALEPWSGTWPVLGPCMFFQYSTASVCKLAASQRLEAAQVAKKVMTMMGAVLRYEVLRLLCLLPKFVSATGFHFRKV